MWFAELIRESDGVVCSVTVSALLLTIALIVFSAVCLWASPAAFSIVGFGSAGASIVGSFGTIKIFRDRGCHDGDPQ